MAKRKKPVKGAVIGCGNISPSHFNSYKAAGIELVAVMDVDPRRAEARKAEFGTEDTEIFTDHKSLLKRKDIELVTVATPVAYHAPITIDALKAGKHVACEKPSTLSIKENKAIIKAWRAAKKECLFFSSRYRWGDATLAREYIQNGELGDIYKVDVTYYRRRGRPGVDMLQDAPWFVNKKLAGGGVIMDMGQYFMDCVMDLVGWPTVTAVSGSTFTGFPNGLPKGTVFDVEEHCTILARTKEKCTFTFDIAWIANHSSQTRITILGTKGGISMTNDKGFTYFCDKGGPWQWMNHSPEWKDNTKGNDHIYQNLCAKIRGDKKAIVGTNPEQALALTELTQAALQSADENKEIKISQLKGS